MHWAQAILFCGGLIYAAVDDLRTRTVSNIVCIVIALAGLITISPASLFGALLAMLPFYLCAGFGLMGGGDWRVGGGGGRRGFAVSRGGGLCAGSWTGTHGILFYGRRAPADIPCHACIPGTAAECGEEAAAGAIFRSGFYSRVFSIRRKTI